MKGCMLFLALFMVFLIGCCKFLTSKREWSKSIHQKPLSREEDSKEKQFGNWSNLPTNISELILRRLSREDFYRFGEVCTSWRQAFIESIIYKSSSPLPSMPLLLVYQLNILSDVKAGFFSLKEQKTYYPKTPLFSGKEHCLGSIEGWLIMVDFTQNKDQTMSFSTSADHQPSSFFFWNPISNAKVMLPANLNIPYVGKWYELFCKVKASSGPDCPDCLVAGLFSNRHYIAFCRPNDESWSIISVENNVMNTIFYDIELLHGKCYVLTETITKRKIKSILVYGLQDPGPLQEKMLIVRLQQQYKCSLRLSTGRLLSYRNFNSSEKNFCYLASNPAYGDLYLIYITIDMDIYLQPQGQNNNLKFVSPSIEKEFVVYKVDLSNQPWLVEVQSLRDGILFLSHKGSKIVPSSTIAGPEDLSKGNTIYFVQPYPYKENPPFVPQIVKFCMADKRINHIHLPESKLGLKLTYLWFMPTLW